MESNHTALCIGIIVIITLTTGIVDLSKTSVIRAHLESLSLALLGRHRG